MNLAELLVTHPFAAGDDLIHGQHGSLTKRAAVDLAESIRADLVAAGVQPGQPVTVQLSSGLAWVPAMVGAWLTDAVFVPINPRLPEAAVADIITDAQPAARIDDDGVHAVDGPARSHSPGTAFVLWTSGTTGRPKPILHTHDAYIEIIDRVLSPLSANRDMTKEPTPNLIPVSMALNAGIYNALFGLRAGAPLVIMDRFTTGAFAGLVNRYGIRSTVLPPAAMAMLSNDETIEDLAPLRYVRSITAPLSPFQARRFAHRFGVTILNSYGQAELGEVIGWTAGDAKEHPDKIGAAGRPHPGVSARLADVDANGVGELLVQPPAEPAAAVMAALAERRLADGFVRTGDLARIDDDGFVWIEGRVGDLINRGGNKVFPDEVEEVLEALPAVGDVAVVGVDDDRLGQVPVAFVVETEPIEDAELEAACRAYLAPYKVPVRFERVAAIPRSEIGKILRRDLIRPMGDASPS